MCIRDSPTSEWKRCSTVVIGPRIVRIPKGLTAEKLKVYIGLYDPKRPGRRALLPGADAYRRVLLGTCTLRPKAAFLPTPQAEKEDLARYLRAESEFMRSLHPFDRFLRITQEVLGPLHQQTAFKRLTRFEFLTEDKAVRKAAYGRGKEVTTVVANLSKKRASVETPYGTAVLPPWGFVITSPHFAAFNVLALGKNSYPSGVLFTVRSLGKEPLDHAEKIRIFRGFGPGKIFWLGRPYQVEVEKVVSLSYKKGSRSFSNR